MTQLSRDRIVSTAAEILQTYGLPDLSIRKVATTLGVQPGALYWYFPHKQALLGAVCAHILESDLPPVDPPLPPLHIPATSPWARQIISIATDLRTRALAFRDGSELMSAALAARTTHFPQLDALTRCVSEVSPTPQLHAHALLLFMLGALMDEQNRRQLAELTGTHTPPASSADILEAGLSAMLKGLAVAPPPDTPTPYPR